MERDEVFAGRDYVLSPCSGLTRDHWKKAAVYLLEGIFSHIPSFDAPVVTVRRETQVTYPHLDAPEQIRCVQEKAQIFEGLARSFMIASVILHEEPELCLSGIPLREYYKTHILLSCTKKGHREYVGSYEEMQEATGWQDPFRPFQQTVETCALVIGLAACREEIWQSYSQEEKDAIAAFLKSYAEANTVPQNWRLFNMLDMAFLNREGYPIDQAVMRDHAQAILGYYAGDGWYRDGHSFDYYSCWAFSFYAPLWNLWYGYEHEPCLAARFEENSHVLMRTFPRFFDEDGFVNMWGRSSIYRNAVTSAFDANFFLKQPSIDPGLARRIASGALLQFMERDDFLWEGIPTLGFYGQFSPMVQPYSCAESVFWMGKAFFCLHLPGDHPFWKAVENNGIWDQMESGAVMETILPGPGLAVSNHKANGETSLRTGKVLKDKDDNHGMWGYAKLCYNTKYPWEASPAVDGKTFEEAESMQYVLKDLTDRSIEKCNVTLWCGEKDGILYRRQFFGFDTGRECHWMHAVNLADFPVPFGIIRVDKLRLYKRPVSLTLGAFGFPDNGTEVLVKETDFAFSMAGTEITKSSSEDSASKSGTAFREEQGKARAVILKGCDHTGRPRSLAMTIYDGWDELKMVHSTGTNPDSDHSILLYAKTARLRQYDSTEPYILISQVITRDDGEDFTEEEIFPVKEIRYTDKGKTGACGPVTVSLRGGRRMTVCFDGMEGEMML